MTEKIVEIRRKPNTTSVPNEIYNEAKRKIGCCLTKSGEIQTGLTLQEQKELLPDIIGVAYEEHGFRKAVSEYFSNLTILTPMSLNITKDDLGRPVYPFDYIRYRFSIANPLVAENEEAFRKSSTKYMFIVFDYEAERRKTIGAMELRKSAYKEFIKISGNDGKMDTILKVIGKFDERLETSDKEVLLNRLVDDEPEKFLSLVLDKDIEIKAFIEECITKEVLRRVGTSILNGDESLGSTMDEAILYLKDKKNSEVFTTLKARLQMFKN